MNCDQIRPKISPYLDGELGSEERRNVDVHLENCPDCSLFYEELVALDDELQSLGNYGTDPKSFRAELLEKADREITTTPTPRNDRDQSGAVDYSDGLAYVTATIMLGLGLLLGGYLSVGLIAELSTVQQTVVDSERSQPQNVPGGTDAPRFFQASSFSDAYFEVTDASSAEPEP
jgi:anti-sigma factor RsiW